MSKLDQVLAALREKADPEKLAGMAHFGMTTDARLGIPVPDLRALAKETGRDHALALALWEAGVQEARILATMVDIPAEVTPQQMDTWAADFNSWDICDHACGNLFDKTPHAWDKLREWASREEEYVRRAAYALLACLAWHDKKADDARFIAAFPVIKAGARDPRNFVRKAVNWALRNIGKRNLALNGEAIRLSEELLELDDPTARWIAKDALRELRSEKIQERLKKKG